jgi:hypothetical protein
MTGVFGAAELSLCCLLLAAATGHAQSPPSDPISTAPPAAMSGLVPTYEINKIARAAGFSPLAPPQREGTTYVLRAIDSCEILMRVVVDARSGAMEAAFCVATLEDALARHGKPDIFNTDQGSQFASEAFTGVLAGNDIARSERSIGSFPQGPTAWLAFQPSRAVMAAVDHA